MVSALDELHQHLDEIYETNTRGVSGVDCLENLMGEKIEDIYRKEPYRFNMILKKARRVSGLVLYV